MKLIRTILFALFLLPVCACVYKMDVRQGNPLDSDAIEQVQPGMLRTQVRYLLGTPMVSDPFHQDRWDYVYYLKRGKTGKVIKRRVEVFFDGDRVDRVVQPDS